MALPWRHTHVGSRLLNHNTSRHGDIMAATRGVGARARGLAGGRCFPHTPCGKRQSERAHHHDGGMMAEKLSDAILGRAPLPLSEAKVYIAPNYETAQR